MVGPGEEFEDDHDDDGFRSPLPPEDRLWRHPSEVGRLGGAPDDLSAVQRRWLTRTPTRAAAWSAGLAGALLAAGLVLVGVHLTAAVVSSGAASAPAGGARWSSSPGARSGDAFTTTSLGLLTRTTRVLVDPGLRLAGARVARSLALVEASSPGAVRTSVGLVVGAAEDEALVLTSRSTLLGATGITVMTTTGEELVGELLGSDPASDLALVGVRATGLPPAALANSDELRPGSIAAEVSVGSGWFVLSVLTILATTPSSVAPGAPALAERLQTDMAVPGSAPGAVLVDGDGEVIGVLDEPHGTSPLALPAPVVRSVALQLATHGSVVHGWLGIDGVTSPPGRSPGVKVLSVFRNSPAALAGVAPGDVITSVDGVPISSMAALEARLYLMPPGTLVRLGVESGGRSIEVALRLCSPGAWRS